jgi:hypothetical protein
MTCLHCGATDADVGFPLARPRKDGSRWRFRYCDRCLAEQQEAYRWGQRLALRGGGQEAKRRGDRESRWRQRYQVVLGPARCHECGERVWWCKSAEVRVWRDVDMRIHRCAKAVAA